MAVLGLSWSTTNKLTSRIWKSCVTFRRSVAPVERRRSGVGRSSCSNFPGSRPAGLVQTFPGPFSSCWLYSHCSSSWPLLWVSWTPKPRRILRGTSKRPAMDMLWMMPPEDQNLGHIQGHNPCSIPLQLMATCTSPSQKVFTWLLPSVWLVWLVQWAAWFQQPCGSWLPRPAPARWSTSHSMPFRPCWWWVGCWRSLVAAFTLASCFACWAAWWLSWRCVVGLAISRSPLKLCRWWPQPSVRGQRWS